MRDGDHSDEAHPNDAQVLAATAREVELLGFYDRVRARIVRFLERRGGRLGARTGETLLLVPDVLLLLVRLFLDRGTPQSTRALIGGALAYFLMPADLAPEIVLGPVGYLEDLVIACTVLGHVMGPEIAGAAERYWSGSGKVYEVLADVSRSGYQILGVDMAERVERLVEGRLLKRVPRDRSAPDASV